MPMDPIKVDFPFAGVHQGVAYEQQPPETSQRIVNMRPRDWSVGGRRRGAVRPGLEKYCPVRVGSGAIRAMAPLPGSTAVLVDDAVLWLDGFDLPATTTAGGNDALGDRDGNGTDDYKVFIAGTTSISTPIAGKSGAEEFFTFQDAFDLRTLPVTVPTNEEEIAVAGRCVAFGFPNETVGASANAGVVRIYRWSDAGELELRATFQPTGISLANQRLGFRVAADYVTASPDTIYVLASAPFEGTGALPNRGSIKVYRSTNGGLNWSAWATYTGELADDKIGSLILEVDADYDWVAVSRIRAISNLVVRTLVSGSPGIGATTAGSISTTSNRVAIRNNHLVLHPGAAATCTLRRWDGAAWNSIGLLQDTTPTNLGGAASWPAFNRSGSRLLLGRPTHATNDGAVFVYLKSGTDIPVAADHRVDTPNATLARGFGSRVSVHDNFGVTRQLKLGSATEFQCIMLQWDSVAVEYETGQRLDTPTVSDAEEFGEAALQMISDDCIALSQYPIGSEIKAIERWCSVSLVGAAPYVDVTGGEGRLQDGLTGLAGWACLFADRGTPDLLDAAGDNAYDNDKLILSIRCKTAPTLVDRTGVVGLFAYGDETAIDANNGTDRASVILCSKFSSGTDFRVAGYVNNAGNMADFQEQAPSFEWQANREYTIRVTLNGVSAIVEVETDGATTLLATCPDIRQSVSGDHAAAGKVATGFIFGSASLDEADMPLFAWVDDFRIATGQTQTQNFNTRVIAVGGPDLAVASSSGATILSGGTGAVSLNQSAWLLYVPPLDQDQEGRVLVYDGQSYRQVDATSLTLTDRTATAGELPGTGSGETGLCRYAVVWQNSVMSWGRDTFPTNWYLSRVADPDDHLYIVANPDGLQAAAGDNTRVGLLPGPITCMIPATADVLLAGTREALFAFVGRPTLGGYLDDVSDLVGIVGPKAATRDDLGNIYFASLRGLYIMPAGSRVAEKLSRGRMDAWFDSIDHSTEEVIVRWSDAEEGVHVYRVPASGAVEHLFWDRQENAFVFDIYPDDFNPSSSIMSVDVAGRPRILVGGRDGFIRSLVPGEFDDDGHDIAAEVFYPPIIGGSRRAILGAMSLRLGQDTDSARWEIRAADGGESLLSAPVRCSGVAAVRRMNHIHRRVGGPVVGVSLRNIGGSRLSIEDLLLHIEAGGLAGRDGQ